MYIINSGLETEQPIRVLFYYLTWWTWCVAPPLQFPDTRSRRNVRYGDCFRYLKTAFLFWWTWCLYHRHWPLEKLLSAGEYGSCKALLSSSSLPIQLLQELVLSGTQIKSVRPLSLSTPARNTGTYHMHSVASSFQRIHCILMRHSEDITIVHFHYHIIDSGMEKQRKFIKCQPNVTKCQPNVKKCKPIVTKCKQNVTKCRPYSIRLTLCNGVKVYSCDPCNIQTYPV